KQLAEKQLFTAWRERDQITAHVSRAWLALDPGDVVTIEGEIARITDISVQGGLLKLLAVPVYSAALNSAAAADAGLTASDSERAAPQIRDAEAYILDI